MKKEAAAPGTGATQPKELPKKIIALQYLLKRSLVQLEAFDLYGDTCLHTTVSTLRNQHGIEILSEPAEHRRANGKIIRFKRHRITEAGRAAAESLLNFYLIKFGHKERVQDGGQG